MATEKLSNIEDLLDSDTGRCLYVVPNELRDSINKVIDEALARAPGVELPEGEREIFYGQLLQLFNERGYVPNSIEITRVSECTCWGTPEWMLPEEGTDPKCPQHGHDAQREGE